MIPPPLRIGFVGSGFIARFHVKSFQSVRHAQITGVFSPTASHRDALAQAVNDAELGPCRAHADLESLLTAPDVDAIWLLAPNDRRLEIMRAIHAAVKSGRSKVRAIACEKPLGRTLAEAREVLALANDASPPTVIWRTRSSPLPSSAARRSSGAAPSPPPAVPTSPARRRSIPDPTSPGSGRGHDRVAG